MLASCEADRSLIPAALSGAVQCAYTCIALEVPTMDKFVARLNIEHLLKQVSEESDDAKRKILSDLLAREEAVLALIEARRARRSDAV
jgi:hypothetical protein